MSDGGCLGLEVNVWWGPKCTSMSMWGSMPERWGSMYEGELEPELGAQMTYMWSWVMVTWVPSVNRQTDRHDWKHNLPATSYSSHLAHIYMDANAVFLWKIRIESCTKLHIVSKEMMNDLFGIHLPHGPTAGTSAKNVYKVSKKRINTYWMMLAPAQI